MVAPTHEPVRIRYLWVSFRVGRHRNGRVTEQQLQTTWANHLGGDQCETY